MVDVAEVRGRLRLTQAQLAALVGVAAATVARWERGNAEIGGPAGTMLRGLDAASRVVPLAGWVRRLRGFAWWALVFRAAAAGELRPAPPRGPARWPTADSSARELEGFVRQIDGDAGDEVLVGALQQVALEVIDGAPSWLVARQVGLVARLLREHLAAARTGREPRPLADLVDRAGPDAGLSQLFDESGVSRETKGQERKDS